MPIVTLTSDFGLKDPDLSVLKAQIFEHFPQANIIDISHDITPFDYEEAIYILKNSLFYFPEKTLHIIALDSEIHKTNRPVLFKTQKHYFLANDNGIVPELLKDMDYKAYYLQDIVFEPMMRVHIEALKNIYDEAFPTLFTDEASGLNKISLLKPVIKSDNNKVFKVIAHVIFVDHYGNSVFNFTKNDFEKWAENRDFTIQTDFKEINIIKRGYNDFTNTKFNSVRGEKGARFNNFGYFEIFVNGSNKHTGGANTLLGLEKGDNITINFK